MRWNTLSLHWVVSNKEMLQTALLKSKNHTSHSDAKVQNIYCSLRWITCAKQEQTKHICLFFLFIMKQIMRKYVGLLHVTC